MNRLNEEQAEKLANEILEMAKSIAMEMATTSMLTARQMYNTANIQSETILGNSMRIANDKLDKQLDEAIERDMVAELDAQMEKIE